MNFERTSFAILTALVGALGGCAAGAEDDEIGLGLFDDASENVAEVEEGIRDGRVTPYDSRFARTSVAVGGCTGTIIGPRHVITAALCNIRAGATVQFYRGSALSGDTALVSRVYQPNGVSSTDSIDLNGKFADYSVLFLDRTIPSYGSVSRLPVAWPGNGVSMAQVGRGQHNGAANPSKALHYRYPYSYAASNAEGHVLMEAATDPGDAGGGIFTTNAEGSQLYVQGVNWGNVFEWATRGKYTSTAYHFPKIAYAIGNYQRGGWDYPGNDISSVAGASLNACISACLASTNCRAYTWVITDAPSQIGTCFWKTGIGAGGNADSGMVSGYRISTGACKADASGICRL
jgi:hypothetical protein